MSAIILLLSFLGFLGLVAILAFVAHVISDRNEEISKPYRKQRLSAARAIDTIDSIVGKYYGTTDLVGQSMGDEIRAAITTHRKDIITR